MFTLFILFKPNADILKIGDGIFKLKPDICVNPKMYSMMDGQITICLQVKLGRLQ